MMSPKPDGILLDKDGTLFDFQATWGAWCGALLAELSGGDTGRLADMARTTGFDMQTNRLRPGSIVVADTPDTIADALLPHLEGWNRRDLVAQMNAAAARAPQIETVPLVPLLSGLRARGIALALVTNDAEAPARAHLAAAGVLSAFDHISGSDNGYGAKPDPGPLLAFCTATGIAPARCAMVGDSAHDMIAARNAGMVAIAVNSGMTPKTDMARLADVCLNHVGEIAAWLDGA